MNRALSVTGGVSSDFDLNPDVVLPEGRKLRPAAVLVGVTMDGSVLLTKRSSRLKHHPGQIAFPGGKQDEGDANLAATALREAQEEVGLPTEIVDIIGTLPTHETVTSFTVTPIVGLIRERFDPLPEAGEVEEVFTVPLTHVTNPARFQVEYRRWQGRRRRYYTVPYGPYYIWGATARILRGLAERMQA
ncbi:coenzyme A pyrophosphatase [Actibacterium pelagium]|uniref:Coenzyme A pyrophosphatase n=1 Tax=Actibacterium pelagium TaxID=2029103 RepID=A0A917EK41_9RHOB|nr:coenzyme A pyrophosphatase [Actibacterium pelagium]